MKTIRRALIIALMGLAWRPNVALAEDTDLFMVPPPDSPSHAPNVLIILDNSANWSASLASGTKFAAEIEALNTVLESLDEQVNVGLMIFGETGGGNSNPVTSYIRFAVRPMDNTNRTALGDLFTGLHTINDKGSNAPYGLGLFEAFKYFGGGTGSTQDATHFGPIAFGGKGQKKRDYAGNNGNNPIAAPLADNAFDSASDTDYASPVTDACAKNYIIYLSNGLPQAGADNPGAGNPNASALLQNVGGNISTIPLSSNVAQGNIGDEYARFLYQTDVSSTLSGTQNINTYTIFTHDPTSVSGNDSANIVLLRSMANQGHGKYFAASDVTTLTNALKQTFQEIQSVNEVFASVSLPVSVNVRGTSLNQVYMGVFRPDPDSAPRWLGNLKEYQLILEGDNVYLGDVNGVRADNPNSGFITNSAVSYWTSSSDFWQFNPSGTPSSASDSPDGPMVEKGGAAQRLRDLFAASQTARSLYTCTGTCTAGPLSATPFNTTTINPSSAANQAAFGVSDAGYSNSNTGSTGPAGEITDIINWVRGADNKSDENLSGAYTDIRASVHGDVVHSRPGVINYNRGGTCAAPDEDDVMVYYGANDGVFHAIKGGNGATDGVEKWGFIPPELYGGLKRLRDNLPANTVDTFPPADTSANKSYFADGSVTLYQADANGDCKYTNDASGDKVYIFLSMRRGGKFIYALDVTNPDNPRLLWKISNSTANFSELGYTWSAASVALVNINGTTTPVLVFGGGYDPTIEDLNPDSITATTATTVTVEATTLTRSMGRRIFVVKASDGSLVWTAGGASSGSASISTQQTVPGMDFAIPSDVLVLDTNGDGKDDRLYTGDTGGNVWRVDIGDPNPANWRVTQLAAIDNSATARRKFLYPPTVVEGIEAGGSTVHRVLMGSGDREHPFNTSITNRFYMFKDVYTGLTSGQATPLIEANLSDATNAIPDSNAYGWYITLAPSEKVVSGATAIGETVFFNTNIPPDRAVAEEGVCTSNLGTAHLYGVNYLDGTGTLFQHYDIADRADLDNKFTDYPGGGFPPSPVPAVVELEGKKQQVVISGTSVTRVLGPSFGTRLRTYWYEEIE